VLFNTLLVVFSTFLRFDVLDWYFDIKSPMTDPHVVVRCTVKKMQLWWTSRHLLRCNTLFLC